LKKLFKIPLLLFVIGLMAGAGMFLYVFHKPQRNLVSEKTIASFKADSLMVTFETDETSANIKYLDKAIEVTGTIDEITPNQNTITINLKVEDVDFGGIKCTLDPGNALKANELKPGQTITLKGKCTGYINDTDLGIKEVSLSSCFLE
jgi:hypothetical protein